MSNCRVCGRTLQSGDIGPKCAKKAIGGDFPDDIKEIAREFIKKETQIRDLSKNLSTKYKKQFKIDLSKIGNEDTELFDDLEPIMDSLLETFDFTFKKPPKIKALPNPPDEDDGGTQAFFDHQKNVIEIYTSNIISPTHLAQTVIHELTHALDLECSQGFSIEGTLDEVAICNTKLDRQDSLFDEDSFDDGLDDLFAGLEESPAQNKKNESNRKTYMKKIKKSRLAENTHHDLVVAGRELTDTFLNFKPIKYHHDPMYVCRPTEVLAYSMEAFLMVKNGNKGFPTDVFSNKYIKNGKELSLTKEEQVRGIKDIASKFEKYFSLLEYRTKALK